MDDDLTKINRTLIALTIAIIMQLMGILIVLMHIHNDLKAYRATINQIEYNVLTIKEGMKK